VKAVALNTAQLNPEEAAASIRKTAALTGLPCADPVRQGGGILLAALVDAPS
jgi:uncharacterized NAD-dependent epimerase/dehydratase family protein